MKKVAILQSNYIPWKGYFDMIAAVDEFILYDDMQYTKNDWRNRNRIKTPQGPLWLTIPIKTKGLFGQTIREAEVQDPSWAADHWKALHTNYRRASCYDEIASWLEPIYINDPPTLLSPLNRRLIEAITSYLGIKTVITNSWDYSLNGDKSERVADICAQAGGSEYISGPAAKGYLNESDFSARGIKVTWFDYTGYPEYPQLWSGFTHEVSVLDLLFNCGKDAGNYMKHVHA